MGIGALRHSRRRAAALEQEAPTSELEGAEAVDSADGEATATPDGQDANTSPDADGPADGSAVGEATDGAEEASSEPEAGAEALPDEFPEEATDAPAKVDPPRGSASAAEWRAWATSPEGGNVSEADLEGLGRDDIRDLFS